MWHGASVQIRVAWPKSGADHFTRVLHCHDPLEIVHSYTSLQAERNQEVLLPIFSQAWFNSLCTEAFSGPYHWCYPTCEDEPPDTRDKFTTCR